MFVWVWFCVQGNRASIVTRAWQIGSSPQLWRPCFAATLEFWFRKMRGHQRKRLGTVLRTRRHRRNECIKASALVQHVQTPKISEVFTTKPFWWNSLRCWAHYKLGSRLAYECHQGEANRLIRIIFFIIRFKGSKGTTIAVGAQYSWLRSIEKTENSPPDVMPSLARPLLGVMPRATGCELRERQTWLSKGPLRPDSLSNNCVEAGNRTGDHMNFNPCTSEKYASRHLFRGNLVRKNWASVRCCSQMNVCHTHPFRPRFNCNAVGGPRRAARRALFSMTNWTSKRSSILSNGYRML